ncbi:MAG: hypothetical protein BMS9Abin23_1137 [Thermodesulfobacteriota bacterium]|nr:MAG: hypothetical protein BMS9Abin23_1137 [Thermodesulfobacteriota bacterium]
MAVKKRKKPVRSGKAAKKRGGKKGKRKSPLKTFFFFTALAFIFFVVVFMFMGRKEESKPIPASPQKTVYKSVRIFSVSTDGKHLKGAKIKIAKGTIDMEVKEALGRLIKKREKSAIPPGTRLLGVRIRGNTAYVDLSVEVQKNHGGGTMGELLTIYSIVDTVTLNFPAVKNVQILIEGKTKKTLKGHIDISYPIRSNRKIIKG